MHPIPEEACGADAERCGELGEAREIVHRAEVVHVLDIAPEPAPSPLLIGHEEVIEHREVAGVAGDQARAVDLRGRGDQGIWNEDAVTRPVAAPVGTAAPRDFQVNLVTLN